jgi:predicted DNA-binding transcriptional regulator YafY
LKHKEIRTFKLIRIQDAKPLPVQTSPPKNFSPEKYYQGSWGVYSGPLRNVTLHFNRQVAPLIREKQYVDSEMEDRPDGSLILKVKTRGLKEISWWIMQFGEQVEVLSPKTLRKMIASRLKKMSAMYASELEAVDRAIN